MKTKLLITAITLFLIGCTDSEPKKITFDTPQKEYRLDIMDERNYLTYFSWHAIGPVKVDQPGENGNTNTCNRYTFVSKDRMTMSVVSYPNITITEIETDDNIEDMVVEEIDLTNSSN